MSLKQAKQMYTKKKNALNLSIEWAQLLLGVQSLEPKRLEGLKRKLISAWEAFDTAYDEIVAILIEDKTLAAEKEEKDEEHKHFNATVAGLEDDLEGTIAQRR